MGDLTGRTALITGGVSGIGAAVVRLFLREGARVALVDRKGGGEAEAALAAFRAGGGEVRGYEADVSDLARALEVVREVRSAFGGLDILVCNAGINRDAVLWKMEEAAWDDVIAVDLKGVFNYIKAAAPFFKEQKGGKIVAVASINGLRGKFGQANYAAAKAGVIGLCKSAARELGRYNVNVNVVCPGLIDTDMTRALPEEARRQAQEEILLGRIGAPEDVAEMIAFLVSDKARHITGEVIKVDGGQYL